MPEARIRSATDDAPQAAGIPERLQALAARFSQAEIARRAGTSRANVSRYLGGRRVSADFCAALVRGLGVNPAWLLTGEGAMFLADVSAGVGELAGDLLELVQALDAVARVRLGALAGDPDKRTLHALDQALRRRTTLAAELNDRSRPVFAQLLDNLRDALVRGDYPQADDLRKAAEQVGRLCDDGELHRQLAGRQGYLAARFGDTDAAAAHHRRAFLAGLTAAATPADGIATDAYNYANQLDRLGRPAEGRRICDAAIALLGPEQAHAPGYLLLVCKRATFDLNLGELRGCLAAVVPAIGAMPPDEQARVRATYVEALILAGALPWEPADAMPAFYGKPWTMLRFARWLGDAGKIRRAVAAFGEHPERGHNPAVDRWHERWGPWLADAIGEGSRDALAALRRDVESDPTPHRPAEAFERHVLLAEAARGAGDRRLASRIGTQAQRVLDALPPGVTPDLWERALHYRAQHASRTPPPEAAVFFARHGAAGYGLLTPVIGDTLET